VKIADTLRSQISGTPEMRQLPPLAEVMETFQVSRGVALRAFNVLRREGVAEPVPGERWRVVREGEVVDRRPLEERLAELIVRDGLAVGDLFPSTGALADRFGVARPTVSRAMDKLAANGLLSPGQQGKQRTVLALPGREESS
jgi:DNA-binding GntR family transcriptional regulator